MEKRQLLEANRRLMRQLEVQSLTDALTGVPNRRAFDRAFELEAARSERHGKPFGLVALDIDHFKKVNDTYGHEGGDEVLRCFARAVAGALRKGDSLYRCGGEEFMVLLPVADLAGVSVAGERVVAAVAGCRIEVGGRVVPITTSAGGACLQPGGDAREVVALADAALYEAKKAGRNRLCLSPLGAP